MAPSGINCFSCRHFYITHDARFPYGCRAGGFMSRLMPSREMLLNSGIECQFFEPKEKA
ncbi:MAG TPA: uracil-DNA glycosylase [Deltaproteobacteria bacterium]|nr:uracil-DNA glycosylase [Deltaproteobacteria bacterium]HOI06362.1 uracil-DNA glycosylase [Deltaproteobacteria bacterium]